LSGLLSSAPAPSVVLSAITSLPLLRPPSIAIRPQREREIRNTAAKPWAQLGRRDKTDLSENEEAIETRAGTLALGLLAAVGDAAGAAERLKAITDATAEYSAERAAAEKVVAEAETRQAEIDAANADLAEKTAAFQTWVDSSEKAYREREARILTNEGLHGAREAKLAEATAALERRIAEHETRKRQLLSTLGDQ
jgi:Skp family chaperone for outer membrane proteins